MSLETEPPTEESPDCRLIRPRIFQIREIVRLLDYHDDQTVI